ncbi:MAG: exodeoxyribonuclease III [Sphingomonadales bacterium]|nr:exodeoxyribonuclease III [Sphingomonadales bacterium]
MTRFLTYNVNGVRAAARKGLVDWIQTSDADVVALQEIKADADQFDWGEFRRIGYEPYIFPAEKKGYSGVAILTRIEPKKLVYGCGTDWIDQEGRIIRADFDNCSFVSVYIPSGSSGDHRQEKKMEFLDFFTIYTRDLLHTQKNIIISGDYNICREAIDIHDPVRNATVSGFLPEERTWFAHWVDEGWCDSFRRVQPGAGQYSWWSYRAGSREKNLGWRIDYNMISEALSDRIGDARLHPFAMHSDHCPLDLQLNISINGRP